MAVEKVHVVGLRELQRELRKVDSDLPKELRKANLEVAEDVASKARGKAGSQGGVGAKTAPSIKAFGEQRRARIRLGGNKYPFALGAEFGSSRYKQFKAWRGKGGDAGYFLYPTIRAEQGRIIDRYGELIDRITKSAFPD